MKAVAAGAERGGAAARDAARRRRVVCLLRRAMRGTGWAVTLINSDRNAPVTARIEGLDGDVQEGREVTPGRAAEPRSGRSAPAPR